MTACDELSRAEVRRQKEINFQHPRKLMQQLKSAGNATYEGRGVIVRCPSGRRTWQATVTIPDVGQTDFIFDVIY